MTGTPPPPSTPPPTTRAAQPGQPAPTNPTPCGSGKPTSGKVEVCCDASCSSPTLLHTWNVDGSAYGPDDDDGYQAYNFQFDNRGSGRYFRFDFDAASGTDAVQYTPVSLELFQCLEVSSVACEDTGGTLPGGQVVPVEQCAIFPLGNCNLWMRFDICPVAATRALGCKRRPWRQLSEASGYRGPVPAASGRASLSRMWAPRTSPVDMGPVQVAAVLYRMYGPHRDI